MQNASHSLHHVQPHQLVKAIVKNFDEYCDDVRDALKDPNIEIDEDGSVADVPIRDKLAAYYGVKEITSIHNDATNYAVIWIAYKD